MPEGFHLRTPERPPRTSVRVLLVEDSPDDAELILHELERGGYRVTWERVDTRQDLAAALERSRWEKQSLPARMMMWICYALARFLTGWSSYGRSQEFK